MAKYQVGIGKTEPVQPDGKIVGVHSHNGESSHEEEPEDRLATISGNMLDKADSLIYAIVGISFLIGALFALGYSFWEFGLTVTRAIGEGKPPEVASAVIEFVSGLLLVLIIMEVLGTVIHYLKSHATSLRPFLFIGIVSATRSILSIGAKLSIGTEAGTTFNNAMIELGVSAVVILALGITLKLLGRLVEIGSNEV